MVAAAAAAVISARACVCMQRISLDYYYYYILRVRVCTRPSGVHRARPPATTPAAAIRHAGVPPADSAGALFPDTTIAFSCRYKIRRESEIARKNTAR